MDFSWTPWPPAPAAVFTDAFDHYLKEHLGATRR
jgi:hypothetical protein